MRMFVPYFLEKTHHIVNMMKSTTTFHWKKKGKFVFDDIKEAIAHALVLVFQDFTK